MRTLSRYFYECIFTNVGDNNKNSKYNYLVLIVSKISAGELQMLSFSKKKKKKTLQMLSVSDYICYVL